MTTNKYEETYYCVREGAAQACYVNDVVKFLKAQAEPVSCATVARAIFGADYDTERWKRSCASRTGQMLKHLCEGGFAKYIEVKEKPIECEIIDWIVDPDENGELPKLKVHDDNGNEYEIDNPKYNVWKRKGHWGKVKQTVIPTTRKYFWVEN